MLPVRARCEISVAKLIDKIRFIPSHPLHVSCARQSMINRERSKWLIACRDIYKKLSPRLDDRKMETFDVCAPWEALPITFHVNHTVTKTSSTANDMKSTAMQEIQNLPSVVFVCSISLYCYVRIKRVYCLLLLFITVIRMDQNQTPRLLQHT